MRNGTRNGIDGKINIIALIQVFMDLALTQISPFAFSNLVFSNVQRSVLISLKLLFVADRNPCGLFFLLRTTRVVVLLVLFVYRGVG